MTDSLYFSPGDFIAKVKNHNTLELMGLPWMPNVENFVRIVVQHADAKSTTTYTPRARVGSPGRNLTDPRGSFQPGQPRRCHDGGAKASLQHSRGLQPDGRREPRGPTGATGRVELHGLRRVAREATGWQRHNLWLLWQTIFSGDSGEMKFYILIAAGASAGFFLAGLSMGFGVWLGYGRLEAKRNRADMELYCKTLGSQPKE
jgi:hypothetical protein